MSKEQKPLSTVTCQKIVFSYHPPYTEGHTLSAEEAAALNGLFGDNLRNNFAGKVKAAMKAGAVDEAALRAEFTEYSKTYKLGVSSRKKATPKDPVEAEARKLAKAKIVEHLQKNGLDPKNYKEQMEENITKLLTKDGSYLAEAKRRHTATQSIATSNLEDLLKKVA